MCVAVAGHVLPCMCASLLLGSGVGHPYLRYRCEKKIVHTLLIIFYLARRPRPNPTPTVALTLTPTLWEARGRQGRSRGSVAGFVGVFFKHDRPAERQASANQTKRYSAIFSRACHGSNLFSRVGSDQDEPARSVRLKKLPAPFRPDP